MAMLAFYFQCAFDEDAFEKKFAAIRTTIFFKGDSHIWVKVR
jgi:hypothetical protein